MDAMEKILTEIDMRSLLNNFTEEKIDVMTCKMLDDKQLERLGLVTIGDRVRLRDAIHRNQAKGRKNELLIKYRSKIIVRFRMSPQFISKIIFQDQMSIYTKAFIRKTWIIGYIRESVAYIRENNRVYFFKVLR